MSQAFQHPPGWAFEKMTNDIATKQELIDRIKELEQEVEELKKLTNKRSWLKERRQHEFWKKKYKELEATINKKEDTGDVKF